MLYLKVLLIWLVLVACAILNGTLREKVLNEYLGDVNSLPVSGITLSALIFLVSYVSIDLFIGQPAIVYVYVGISWVSLTMAFEYGFGHYVQGKSWTELNQMFCVIHGNLFMLVMIVTAVAPYTSASLKGIL